MMEGRILTLAKNIFPKTDVNSLLEFSAVYFVTLLLAWYIYQWILFNFRSFPPGPVGFPIIGYVRLFLDSPHKVLAELSKKYGKIFSLYFGTDYTVIVTDYESAKEIVTHSSSLSRPKDVFAFAPGKGGFTGINGQEWQEQRRFCVFAMRNLGMGRGPWEKMMQVDAYSFVAEISDWQGKPTILGEHLLSNVAGTNATLFVGRRISKKEDFKTLEVILEANVILSKHASASSLSVLMPWLPKYLIWFGIGEYRKDLEVLEKFGNFFRREIQKHVNSELVEHQEDFIGYYLKEMEKHNTTNKHHYFSAESLLGDLVALFFASTDTTASSLHWLLLLVAAHPEVQEKIHQEIDDVIGNAGEVPWDERKSLPYTWAALLEAQRFVTVNRIFPPRMAEETFKCSGYTIPKGSRILVNSWAVMHDPKYWDNPMEFKPERFIRTDGKDPSKTPGLSTFSFGRRNCPGETVALMTIFVYFTAIMQKFLVTPPPGCKVDLTDGPPGAVTGPVNQKLCFTER